VITAASLDVPEEIVERVFATAIENCGVKIASPAGFVALKLFCSSMQDKADIVAMLRAGGVDVSDFALHPDRISTLDALLEQAKLESAQDLFL